MNGRRVLVQMSGVPGAGKTTVARELVRRRGLVAVDHDVVKSALLGGDVPFAVAGRTSYAIVLALAGDLLAQGHDVIIDSPCLYDELLSSGQRLAARHDADYRYIECVVEGIEELDQRLRARAPMRSQRRSVRAAPVDLTDGAEIDGAALFRSWISGMKRPDDGYLRLDTSRPLSTCVAEALALLDGERARP